jgi:hypothetical protein
MLQTSPFKPQLSERNITTVIEMPQEKKSWCSRYYDAGWRWIEDTSALVGQRLALSTHSTEITPPSPLHSEKQ